MQKKLQKLVQGLRNDEIDLKETPALFKWNYPEDPWIEYSLLINEVDQASLPLVEASLH